MGDQPHGHHIGGACQCGGKVVEQHGQHLQNRLDLAPHIGGDNGAGFGGEHTHTRHGELAEQNDRQHHGAADAAGHHIDKGGSGQALVGQGVHKLAEIGDKVIFARQVAVQKIREAGHGKDNARDKSECRVEIGGTVAAASCKHHKNRHKNNAKHR